MVYRSTKYVSPNQRGLMKAEERMKLTLEDKRRQMLLFMLHCLSEDLRSTKQDEDEERVQRSSDRNSPVGAVRTFRLDACMERAHQMSKRTLSTPTLGRRPFFAGGWTHLCPLQTLICPPSLSSRITGESGTEQTCGGFQCIGQLGATPTFRLHRQPRHSYAVRKAYAKSLLFTSRTCAGQVHARPSV